LDADKDVMDEEGGIVTCTYSNGNGEKFENP